MRRFVPVAAAGDHHSIVAEMYSRNSGLISGGLLLAAAAIMHGTSWRDRAAA